MIYKMMPRVQVRWHDVWLGAVVTALLFTIGKFLIGLYIGKSGVASGFGAAGSLVVLFVWVYYSAQIFLLGAEFTWVYARTFGSMREQKPTAEKSAAAEGAGPADAASAPSRRGEGRSRRGYSAIRWARSASRRRWGWARRGSWSAGGRAAAARAAFIERGHGREGRRGDRRERSGAIGADRGEARTQARVDEADVVGWR